jgi:hypothetical protein
VLATIRGGLPGPQAESQSSEDLEESS